MQVQVQVQEQVQSLFAICTIPMQCKGGCQQLAEVFIIYCLPELCQPGCQDLSCSNGALLAGWLLAGWLHVHRSINTHQSSNVGSWHRLYYCTQPLLGHYLVFPVDLVRAHSVDRYSCTVVGSSVTTIVVQNKSLISYVRHAAKANCPTALP